VAESCTGGLLSSRIVATPGSGDWFKGALVAYHSEIKFRLLGLPEGPVITDEASILMATGVRMLLDTDIGVAITGVAGPEPEEDQAVGTVFVGVASANGAHSLRLSLSGDPDEVRRDAAERAFDQLEQARKQ